MRVGEPAAAASSITQELSVLGEFCLWQRLSGRAGTPPPVGRICAARPAVGIADPLNKPHLGEGAVAVVCVKEIPDRGRLPR